MRKEQGCGKIMLAKINKIKGLGLVFSDFAWPATTPAFQKVNLVYGWNGCGKTTLTRLFQEVSARSTGSVEYELETDDGRKFGPSDVFAIPIRVFNQDYVQNNVRILESSANTISVLLGEENKDLVTQIEADERALYGGDPANHENKGKIAELQGYTQKKSRKERENEAAFTEIARTIGAALIGSSGASRNYRSPDAKRDFGTIEIPQILSAEDIESHILSLKQELLPELDRVKLANIVADGVSQSPVAAAGECLRKSRLLCSATIETQTIARLRDNADIADWVEQGLSIHQAHSSKDCEYCGRPLTGDRLSLLAKHFSEADRALKGDIDNVLVVLRAVHSALTSLSPHDQARFYRELQTPYAKAAAGLAKAKGEMLAQVTSLGKILQAKKSKTTEAIALEVEIDSTPFAVALDELNALADAHNAKSRDFKKLQSEASKKIKTHYLSTIFDDVTRRRREITDLGPDLDRRSNEVAEIEARIAAARAKISSEHKACEQINKALATFLGRNELRFEPDVRRATDTGGSATATVGYKILRGDMAATHLSEGEKTAIAFVYFVVHISDGQFSKKDGIVIVDDPVSSLDSNSLYQAFSFLKNAIADCRQAFVLTHNFDFLKLLLNWRSHSRKRDTGFYMIRNYFAGNDRRASINEMDRELKEYESEYHYLFRRLKEMKAEQDGSILRAYPVPNIARKVWESFLMYRVPDGNGPYIKMERLKKEGFDPQKLDAIYKFTNDQSHITGAGFDPALVPEAQKVLTELFDMMKLIAPEHFAILDEATQTT